MFKNTILELCPDVQFFSVPSTHGKSDLTVFRSASREVFDILTDTFSTVERASIDEAYIDLTAEVKSFKNQEYTIQSLKNTAVGLCKELENFDAASVAKLNDAEKNLLYGAVLMERCRQKIEEVCSFQLSAGIAGNKMLAKLVCGFNKPNKQTVVLPKNVKEIMDSTKIEKVRNFGGKLGSEIKSKLKVEFCGEICSKYSLNDISKYFCEETANWVYSLGRGVDHEIVTNRTDVKSVGCSKMFLGKSMIKMKGEAVKWIGYMCEELKSRLKFEEEEVISRMGWI